MGYYIPNNGKNNVYSFGPDSLKRFFTTPPLWVLNLGSVKPRVSARTPVMRGDGDKPDSRLTVPR